MLLVVCPNLATDRILEVQNFQATLVQRSQSVIVQPGGKGSNVARVYRQLGGDAVLVGFVGRGNMRRITEPLRHFGVQVDVVPAFARDSRTCTIICDPVSANHPTVINEEGSEVEAGSEAKLLAKVEKWMPHVDTVLTTGSLPSNVSADLYAQIIDLARFKGKVTGLDATGLPLRRGLLARPSFIKPNSSEFCQLIHSTGSGVLMLPPHTAVTIGKAGALVIHEGRCLYASPPQLFDVNPIGAGDAFVAGYLKYLKGRADATECLKFAMAAAASDASTLRPGFVDRSQVERLASKVAPRFQPSYPASQLPQAR
jgi:tagatose 6-phosphate kinase